MRKQIEILIYQYKKQNNLDVYSALDFNQVWNLLIQIKDCIKKVDYKFREPNEKRRMV